MNAISVCSGIGGLDLGLKLADERIRTVCYVERETFAAAALVARMEDSTMDKAPVWDDLKSFPCEQWSRKVDLVIGGIPCQPFSCAGKQQGVNDDRWLWDDFWRIVCGVGAWSIFIENVPNIINHGLGNILGTLAEAGWSAEWDVFSARQCGAPHIRKRFFLLGYANNNRFNGKGISDEPGNTYKIFTGTNKDMGYSDVERLERSRTYGECADKQFAWPPGPSEHERWAEWPSHLKPAVCGDVNGISDELVESALQHRADRIRCLGNAVVPITAAIAYSKLRRRILEGYYAE